MWHPTCHDDVACFTNVVDDVASLTWPFAEVALHISVDVVQRMSFSSSLTRFDPYNWTDNPDP